MLLEEHRKNLFPITQKIFNLSLERQALVTKIHNIKAETQMEFWDPAQEISLFRSLKSDLEKRSIKELLWVSLLIEMQSSSAGNYPCWSEKKHLKQTRENISEQINPILLKMFYPEQYASLGLIDSLKIKLQECFANHE